MATTAKPEVIDTTPVWKVLYGLDHSQIPHDLSEVDAEWCYEKALDYCPEELESFIEGLDWRLFSDMAYDLRDIWHSARADAADLARGLY